MSAITECSICTKEITLDNKDFSRSNYSEPICDDCLEEEGDIDA